MAGVVVAAVYTLLNVVSYACRHAHAVGRSVGWTGVCSSFIRLSDLHFKFCSLFHCIHLPTGVGRPACLPAAYWMDVCCLSLCLVDVVDDYVAACLCPPVLPIDY